MIRNLLLVPELPINLDEIKGGVHSASVNLIKGFSLLNIKVSVISFSREVHQIIRKNYSSNIELIYIPEGVFKLHTLNYLLNVPIQLKKQIKDFDPDIIHFEVGNTFMLSKILGLCKKKYVLTIHGMSYEEGKIKKRRKEKLIWYFNALIQDLMYPKNIIHLSEFSKNKFAQFSEFHTAIIPNAVKDEYFNVPMKIRTENKLLYIGLIDINKNLIFLLRQLRTLNAKHYNFTLIIAGDFISSEYKSIIHEYIISNQLEKNVSFLGWITQQRLLSVLSESDIVVVSSMHESLPMVIAESMAAGKVVVSSNVGGIPEMIKDKETGFLYSIKNDKEFEAILSYLYNNHQSCSYISNNARNFAYNNYHFKKVAEKTIQFYTEVIND